MTHNVGFFGVGKDTKEYLAPTPLKEVGMPSTRPGSQSPTTCPCTIPVLGITVITQSPNLEFSHDIKIKTVMPLTFSGNHIRPCLTAYKLLYFLAKDCFVFTAENKSCSYFGKNNSPRIRLQLSM